MKNLKHLLLIACGTLTTLAHYAQTNDTMWGRAFTKADTLRGSLGPLRSCYNVYFYDLTVSIDPENKYISGHNIVHFEVTESTNALQLDLRPELNITAVSFHYPKTANSEASSKASTQAANLPWERQDQRIIINFPDTLTAGARHSIKVAYAGKPIAAKRAPWDGGLVWAEDEQGRPWVGTACQGVGASAWWPCKDHHGDEPDSMRFTMLVPPELTAVGNGNLRSTKTSEGLTAYEWFVSYPINIYNISANVAHYTHFHDTYQGKDGRELDLDYYVLDYNEEEARQHFRQVKPMLACYEENFGPYPFWNDGYALVETSYWGMEHQSAVAYGNNYENLPAPYSFDFIIIHETGHEYWGNSVSMTDNADMWIHESFCTYAEAIYLECLQSKAVAVEYLVGQRERINNEMAIQGPRGVNFRNWPDADMYFKGSWMLHSMRHAIDNDVLWKNLLHDLAQYLYIRNTTSEEVQLFMNRRTDFDLMPMFRQYLETTMVPELQYTVTETQEGIELSYRWHNVVSGFNMPAKWELADGTVKTLQPSATEVHTVMLEKAQWMGSSRRARFMHELFYATAKKVNSL